MRIQFSAAVSSLLLAVGTTATLQAQTTADFFNDSVLQEVHLRMTPADWQTLHEKYLENTYYPCSFEWNGIVLDRIGIRSRGSQSRSPIKPSIGIDFSRYSSSQRFLGLKSLVMRNLNQDATMMHERLAEALFAKLGMPHSREAHARLYVNDEYAGVYLLVEAIDARFAATQLGEDSGYLYDYTLGPGYRFHYLGSDPKLYVPVLFDPKTRSDDPDAEGLVETIRLVTEASDADFYRLVSPRIDLDDFVAHAAIEQAVAQWDGLLGINGMNNFYLYRWESTRQAMFLVWDQDGAFLSKDWPVWQGTEDNVLMRRALRVPRLRELYVSMLRNAAEAMGGEGGWLWREIGRVDAQIRRAVIEDPVRLCRNPDIGPCPFENYESGVNDLRYFARDRAAAIAAELGLDSHPLRLSPGSLTNLASGEAPVTAGSLARIRANLPLARTFFAFGPELPTSLGGVVVNTAAGPSQLLSAGPDGVVFMVPAWLSCAPQPVTVSAGGAESNAIMADVMPTAAGVFGVVHSTGVMVSPEWPAAAGELVSIYATGVWPGNTGAPVKPLELRIGTQAARLIWAGPAGLPGVQKLTVQLPEEPASGDDVPLVITLDSEPGFTYPVSMR